MTTVCTQCVVEVVPEDSVYDDNMAQYFCTIDCFRDWADDNNDVVTDYYMRLNVTE